MLRQAIKDVCTQSMNNAVEQREREINKYNTAIFDGSWQLRGYTSQNNASETTGKGIDVRVLTKYCRSIGRLENNHETNCMESYSGVSGGMEVQGILDMFRQSRASHNNRYKDFLGDGDSSANPTVVVGIPYGSKFSIKLECVGHVQKRIGKLKTKMGQIKFEGDKIVEGCGRVSNVAINAIQN